MELVLRIRKMWMKIFVVILNVFFMTSAAYAEKPTFSIYTDANAHTNHFSPSGRMGDYGDIRINEGCHSDPRTGRTCIEIQYSGRKSQGAGWAGIYWQSPPNNWGNVSGGYDLSGAKQLVLWIKGEKGGERIERLGIGGINGAYPDSDVAGIGPLTLTNDWQEIIIDLEGKNLSSISGGLFLSTSAEYNPHGFVIHLDDIRYE